MNFEMIWIQRTQLFVLIINNIKLIIILIALSFLTPSALTYFPCLYSFSNAWIHLSTIKQKNSIVTFELSSSPICSLIILRFLFSVLNRIMRTAKNIISSLPWYPPSKNQCLKCPLHIEIIPEHIWSFLTSLAKKNQPSSPHICFNPQKFLLVEIQQATHQNFQFHVYERMQGRCPRWWERYLFIIICYLILMLYSELIATQ